MRSETFATLKNTLSTDALCISDEFIRSVLSLSIIGSMSRDLTKRRQKTAWDMEQIVKSTEKEASERAFWTAKQFQAWQDAIGLSGQKAAAALGVSDNSITNFRRRGCSRTIALACIALYGRQDETKKPWEIAA